MAPKLSKLVKYALQVYKTLINDMVRCDLFRHASAMAYVTLLSIIPSLAATFALISIFTPLLGEQGNLLDRIKEYILQHLAAGSGDQVVGYIEALIGRLDVTRIGLTGFAGITVSLILLLRQIEIALNKIWLVQRARNPFTRFVYFWTFITLGTFIIGITFGVTSGFSIQGFLPIGDDFVAIDRGLIAELAPALATFAFFVVLYKVVPNTYVTTRHAALGAFPAAILFLQASRFYGTFTTHFTGYEAIYGALAAIPLFLMWLYILWIITLLGAVLSWRAQQGFQFEELDPEVKGSTPEERLRNHQVQGIIPILALLAIYHRYNDGNGRGISGEEIAKQLNLPDGWVSEGLETILSFKYAVPVMSNNEKEMVFGDLLSMRYYPAIPAHQLNLKEIAARFSTPCMDWLKDWQHHSPLDLKQAAGHMWLGMQQACPKTNLNDLLQQVPSK